MNASRPHCGDYGVWVIDEHKCRCLMTGNLATGLPGARIGGLRHKLNSIVHYTERATTKTERAETIPPGFH